MNNTKGINGCIEEEEALCCSNCLYCCEENDKLHCGKDGCYIDYDDYCNEWESDSDVEKRLLLFPTFKHTRW